MVLLRMHENWWRNVDFGDETVKRTPSHDDSGDDDAQTRASETDARRKQRR